MTLFTYCSWCAGELKQKTQTEHICTVCHRTTYNNPRASTGVFIVNGPSVLLAIRKEKPHKGKLDVIGGFLEFNEDPIAGLKREVKEETGLSIKNISLIGVYCGLYNEDVSYCTLMYIAEIKSGTLIPGDDVASLVWHPIKDVPTKDFAWPWMKDALTELKARTENSH